VDVVASTPRHSSSPPAVPDGREGSPLRVDRDGDDLVLSWDSSLCAVVDGHHLIFGGGGDLPSSPGGPFVVVGSVCGLGSSSPLVWSSSPDPLSVDPATGLLWFLVLADDGGTVEGSWGTGSDLAERNSVAPDGNSGQCGIGIEDLSNTCGAGASRELPAVVPSKPRLDAHVY
jgi:hypothetical protein